VYWECLVATDLVPTFIFSPAFVAPRIG
jgi:hypothetical protein